MITKLAMVSSESAMSLVISALEKARADGLSIAVAVVDAQGHVLASARMDEVSPPILEFAQDKAFTAATMRRSTEAFADRMGSSASLTLGLSTRSRLLVWGGGLPIFHEGRVIGGIGVSGAKDAEDIACAQEALKHLGLSWQP